jgi:nucleoside-diphosphate-sugar epimerase
MLEGLVSMMESSELGPINLGNDKCEFTLNELVVVFERVLGRKVEIEYLDGTQDDPKVRKPVLNKTKDKLDFKCVVGLDQGIKDTCEYFELK